MLFSSPIFFVYFAGVAVGLLVLRRAQWRVLWLILAGAIFYGYWDARFLVLLAFTTVFEFYLGRLIARSEGVRRRLALALDIAVNLSLLGYFKYANLGVDAINTLLGPIGVRIAFQEILLPIGISFFTFEAMSYCIDIYRRQLKPFECLTDFALFMFFFPRMIAGPIIRAAAFLPQIQRAATFQRDNVMRGGILFLLGMTKKVVLADRVAPSVDAIFERPEIYHAVSLWQGVFGYAVQIYCDFSGYSDMALGLAQIMGFRLPENFRLPYVAESLTDFWRRWHISLSSWLRDYLYVPLGGSRVGRLRMYLNLLVTMALGGLWHGANWTFIAWGVLHGVGLGLGKVIGAVGGRFFSRLPAWLRTTGAIVSTQLFVWLGWVVFRSPNLEGAKTYLLRLVVGSDGIRWAFGPILLVVPLVAIGHVLAGRDGVPLLERIDTNQATHRLGLAVWVLGVFYLGAVNGHGFIYFQF